MGRRGSRENLLVVSAVAVFALVLIAAMVVTVQLTQKRYPGDTSNTVRDTGYTTLTTAPAVRATGSISGETALPPAMPDDFAFVAEWGVARMSTLDTFGGTFTKDLVSGSPPTATTKLVLTLEELRRLYAGLRTLDPWSYPDDFHPPHADATSAGIDQGVSPVMRYHLHVLAAGAEKEIWWTDRNGSSAAAAEEFRDWFRLVWTTIESRPEYKALPQARGGYV